MCGIAGYIGKSASLESFKKLMHIMKELDYRGYDSAGMAVAKRNNGKDVYGTLKGTEPVPILEREYLKDPELNRIASNCYMGIAHTRWATHGGVTKENAHPFWDCEANIFVAHNGIISNHKKLKGILNEAGHKFVSDTDTEVIPHMIEENENKGLGFEHAFKKTIKDIRGEYAIAAVDRRYPGEIMVARNYSPLIIGKGDGENFISSDTLPILDYTNSIVRLSDGDIGKVTADKIEVYGSNGKRVIRRPRTIPNAKEWKELSVERFVKSFYNFYNIETSYRNFPISLNEIRMQPTTMYATLNQDPKHINKAVKKLDKASRIELVGSGSSFNAALGGSYLLSELGFDAHAIQSSDLSNYMNVYNENDVIIALSQSGGSMDMNQPLKQIKKKNNPFIISITNVPMSDLSEEIADLNIPMNSGPEYGVVSTKTFTSQQIVLRQLYYGLKDEQEEGNKKIHNTIGSLSKWYWDNCLEDSSGTRYQTLLFLDGACHLIWMGEGINYSVARESALKVNEFIRTPANAYISSEIKHGPLTAICPSDRVIAIAPHDRHFKQTMNAVSEIRAHGGKVVGLSERDGKLFDKLFQIPDVEVKELAAAFSQHVLNMDMAYLKGYAKACDKPPFIAKCVTVR